MRHVTNEALRRHTLRGTAGPCLWSRRGRVTGQPIMPWRVACDAGEAVPMNRRQWVVSINRRQWVVSSKATSSTLEGEEQRIRVGLPAHVWPAPRLAHEQQCLAHQELPHSCPTAAPLVAPLAAPQLPH
jgi:hypothetical protein